MNLSTLTLAQTTAPATAASPAGEVPNGMIVWLGCLFFFLLFLNEGRKFLAGLKGKSPHPPNELLDAQSSAISGRVARVEGSVRTLYGFDKDVRAIIQDTRLEFTRQIEESKAEIIAAGDRRGETINAQFREIAASLARLDERTK